MIPSAKIDTSYVKFAGGLDLISPVLSIKPGMALSAMNYEPGIVGGYKKIDGFERTDGRLAPSAAVYYYVTYTLTGAVAIGNTITGVTSGATGYVTAVEAGALAFTKLTGTFVAGETINVAAAPQGTLTIAPILGGYRNGYDDAVALNAAADVYRADITKVNGAARSIRGVQMYKGTVYAFQNNAGGTACEMWKSSGSGWTLVSLGEEIAFTSGGTYVIAEGDTITGEIGGATAVVTRVVLTSGTFAAGTAAGYLTFASHTGTFQAETIKVGANLNVANIAGASAAITLLPSGRYEFCLYNFFGSTNTLRMYGCDGVNPAFEFDGTVFVKIRTGMAVDTPSYICAHKKMLFLSFKGSLQNSGIGTPYIWTATTGASEIGVGDDITGLLTQPGDTLAIFTRNSSWQLRGSSVSDFVLAAISAESGAIGRTCQNIGEAYCLDDRGVVQVSRTQNYGNFDYATVSRSAQSVVDTMRAVVTASSVYKTRNQYRLYGSDGSGLILTIEGGNVVGITQFKYPVNVTCVCSGEDSNGKDVIFFGADNGYVYQADKGSSFDGEEIEAYLRLPFNNINSPRIIKRYRKAVLEMSSVGYTSIRFQPEFSYGDSDIAPHVLQTITGQGTGGYWDVDTWGQFFYDARIVNSPEFNIVGSGLNMALIFYSKSDIDLGHILQGCLVNFSTRRLAR